MKTLLERTFQVEASLDDAWAHLARVESWPSWARHIRTLEITPPGELTDQSAGALVLTNGIRSTFRMTELNPGTNWKWTGPFLWITVDYDHQFRELGPRRCEIRFVLEGSGFGVGVFGRLFAAIYARNLDRAIPRLIAELNGKK